MTREPPPTGWRPALLRILIVATVLFWILAPLAIWWLA